MENKYKLKLWQDGFLFDKLKYKFLKSGWGTGKTLALVLGIMNECDRIEGNEVLVCQKEFTDLRDTTIKDFERVSGEKLDGSRNLHRNGSVVMFRHLEELSRQNLQNMNLGAFFIDQGEFLLTDETFNMLCGRLRRTKYSPDEFKHIKTLSDIEKQKYWDDDYSCKGYIVSNAKGHNWIYKIKQQGIFEYDKQGKKTDIRLDSHYSATTFENIDNLRDDFLQKIVYPLKDRAPGQYNRYVLNLDDEDDETNCIIQRKWLEEATNKKLSCGNLKFISCDPSADGNDETVIKLFDGLRVVDGIKHKKKSEMETVGILINYKKTNGALAFVVDGIGIGSGIVSRLRELKEPVICIKSSETARNPEKYCLVATEMWAESADAFYKGLVSIPDDSDLKDQLCSRQYDTVTSKGQYKIQSKSICKKLLGRSPDDADAVVMGIYAYLHDMIRPLAMTYGQSPKSSAPKYYGRRY